MPNNRPTTQPHTPDPMITAPASVYIDGHWCDAQWLAEVVDADSGEMVITAIVITDPATHVAALRMTTSLVRQLRTAAGFDTPHVAAPLVADPRVAQLARRLAQTDDALTMQYASLQRRVDDLAEDLRARLTRIEAGGVR